MGKSKGFVGRRRTMVLVTMAVVVLAAALAIGSAASFTASSANPGNVFTAGALSIGNYKADWATSNEGQTLVGLVNADNMAPGDTVTGTAYIKNTGSVSGVFSLSGQVTAGDADFASYLRLTVKQDGATIVDNQPLATALTTPVSLGSWAAGEQHVYTFEVTFPDGAPGADNVYMGKSCTLGIAWSAVSD
jgi:hypothetical protein